MCMFWKYNFLLPYENKDNFFLTLLGKWVLWVWVWFYPKPIYFYRYSISRNHIHPIIQPNPFFGIFWVGLTGFSGLTQPMNTPIKQVSHGHITFFYNFLIIVPNRYSTTPIKTPLTKCLNEFH